MEQSPLNHLIPNLEAEVKAKLLHRTTPRAWLTRAGMRCCADAKRILNEIYATSAAPVLQRNENHDRVRLALIEDLAGVFGLTTARADGPIRVTSHFNGAGFVREFHAEHTLDTSHSG